MKPHLCLAIVCLSTHALAQEDASPDKSHFRLFAAEIQVDKYRNSQGTSVDRKCLFKIDMRTGQTWRFVSVESGQGVTDYWQEIRTVREPNAQERAEISAALANRTNNLPDFKTLKEVQTPGPARPAPSAEEFLDAKPKPKP